MTLKKSTVVTILNGIVNPLLMCSFLPIIEGKAALDFQGVTGFWGQLALAIAIAQIVSFMPLFGKTVGMCVEFFGFEPGTPGARVCGTVVGATLLFCLIGLFEIAFQTGFGVVKHPIRAIELKRIIYNDYRELYRQRQAFERHRRDIWKYMVSFTLTE